MTLEVTNSSSVELKIDPTVILATKNDINILTNSIALITTQLSEKIELYIGETLPAIADRKEKTMYLKITDIINSGTTGNLKVSPTMGIKII